MQCLKKIAVYTDDADADLKGSFIPIVSRLIKFSGFSFLKSNVSGKGSKRPRYQQIDLEIICLFKPV